MAVDDITPDARRVVSLDVCVKALAAALSALVVMRLGPGLGAVTAVCGLVVSEAVTALVRHLRAKRSHLLGATGIVLFIQADSSFGAILRRLLGDRVVDGLVHGSTVVAAATTTTAAVGLTAATVAAPQAAGVNLLELQPGPDGALSETVSFAAGQPAELAFEGEEGRRALVVLSYFRGAGAVDVTIESGGAPLRSKRLTPADNLIEVTAARPLTAGPHRIVMRPDGAGSVDVDVFVSPDDATATLTPDADSETAALDIETPGQRANVTLEGAEGDRALLELTGEPSVLYFRKQKLDGTSAFVTLGAGGNVVDIDPRADVTGKLALKATAVPSDVTAQRDLAASPVDEVFTTDAPGQRIDVTLTSSRAGQAFVRLSEATVPDVGEPLREVALGPSQEHHIVVDPEGAEVGGLRVQAWLIPEPATGDVATGAPADITTPGQHAQFPVQVATPAAVSVQGPGTGFTATLLDSAGSGVASTADGCVAVAAAGSYTLIVDPNADGTGLVTATFAESCP